MLKIWKISTPTTEDGPIWMALNNEAEVIFDFWVRCPECNAWQLMTFDHIKFPKDVRDPRKVKAQTLAWYECKSCQAKRDDDIRNYAVRRGRWRERDKGLTLKTFKPKAIGFHIPSWLSYFVSL